MDMIVNYVNRMSSFTFPTNSMPRSLNETCYCLKVKIPVNMFKTLACSTDGQWMAVNANLMKLIMFGLKPTEAVESSLS